MHADADTSAAIRELVERTYNAMSTPGGDLATVFASDDMTVAGSGRGELLYGPDQVIAVAQAIASQGRPWVVEQVKVWRRGEVAWAQILGHVVVLDEGITERVPYWTTGVFERESDGWQWVYWGGAEPQENPKV